MFLYVNFRQSRSENEDLYSVFVGFRGFTSGLYWVPWVNLSPKFTDLMDLKMYGICGKIGIFGSEKDHFIYAFLIILLTKINVFHVIY